MTRKLFVTLLKAGGVVFLLVVLLFSDKFRGASPGFISSALREVAAVFRDPETQWMFFLCLGIYFTAFLFLRSRAVQTFWRLTNPNLWLICVLLISAVLYAIDYSPSTQALTLLGGAVLGQGLAVWAGFEVRSQKSKARNSLGILILSLLVMLLALASVWQTAGRIFEYHSHTRWSGPWDNPNIFGLLMGTGITLAIGSAVSSFQFQVSSEGIKADRSWEFEVMKYAAVILCFFAAILMVRGLLHSYSRGAWMATFCGMSYLGYQVFKCQVSGSLKSGIGNRESEVSCPSCVSWFNKNRLLLSAILLSVVVLSFWHFRQTEWHSAHRAFSVGNQNDFSWRNRIAAWEGALQITAEHPWFGAGWNQPEPMYEHYYLPQKSTESAAIQMNDYLLLGATLGIPALFCFGMYLWLSLFRNSAFSLQPLELLPATCRAGAIVLLVGFWFDGGLFKLPTAATFWILLELGSVELHKRAAKQTNEVF